MPYPPRTKASDAIARDIFRLAEEAEIPKKSAKQGRFMVTVVTTEEYDNAPRSAFIATSGFDQKGEFRRMLNNTRNQGGRIYHGTKFDISATYPEADNLLVPNNSEWIDKKSQEPGKEFLLKDSRHCAETKALFAAAGSGERISGMTTFWWGEKNPYPIPGEKNEQFAAPCDVCSMNADNIMRRVEEYRIQNRRGLENTPKPKPLEV